MHYYWTYTPNVSRETLGAAKPIGYFFSLPLCLAGALLRTPQLLF